MLRSGLICNQSIAFPALEFLIRSERLAGLATGNAAPPILSYLGTAARRARVELAVLQEDFPACLERWLRAGRFDVVFVVTFGKKIPASLLDLPPHGFFNFHTGLLPDQRGPDPVFWAIRNGESEGGLTVHRMDAGFDTGPVALTKVLPLNPHETYGEHTARIAAATGPVAEELILALERGELEMCPQPEGAGAYRSRPTPSDLVVRWGRMRAEEIKALTQATNPDFGGALTFLKQREIRLFQVSLAIAGAAVPGPPPSGTIVAADPAGELIVFCEENHLLRIDVAAMNFGLFSGNRLISALGLRPGDIFYNPPPETGFESNRP